MLTRRQVLPLAGAAFAFIGMPGPIRRAWAQSAGRASAFVKSVGDRLVGVVNGPGTAQTKRQELTRIIDGAVDVDGIARFCLGRYWRTASADQQKRYVTLFHEVLVTNITGKLGDYQGVKFTMGRSRAQEDEDIVSTVVDRPNNPPTNVDWVISSLSGNQKIIDVVAEGTSLRLTQRQDYASFLAHNNGNVDALITAMERQAAG